MPVDALLADPDIEIVINLTVPLAHGPVSRQIITAGKHVYSEKPLAARFTEAQALMLAAAGRGVRVGCAPDTFLGAAHQACRRAIDAGRIGRPIAGAAAVLSHGMEHWHPNPEFFFKRGGGPIHDIGPYYVTQLVNLLGPVTRVTAQASTASPTRTVTSEPRRGQVIEVEVPTTVNGVLSFASGANVSLTASWDVWKHMRLPFEIYGSEGSMLVPDPNFFGDAPQITRARLRLAGARHLGPSVRHHRTARCAAGCRSPTTGSSGCSTWRRRCARAGRIARTAISPCTCSRCWTRSSARRSKGATS